MTSREQAKAMPLSQREDRGQKTRSSQNSVALFGLRDGVKAGAAGPPLGPRLLQKTAARPQRLLRREGVTAKDDL